MTIPLFLFMYLVGAFLITFGTLYLYGWYILAGVFLIALALFLFFRPFRKGEY
jgi:uncharacterized membrane protein